MANYSANNRVMVREAVLFAKGCFFDPDDPLDSSVLEQDVEPLIAPDGCIGTLSTTISV